ncbi:MAG: UDP-N-acetylglucosamine 1-carboxyvinyltransferase [Alphaproteobacteria bacterium CG_4_10_14_0_8_um_filter_53_9]|nr:MAG: UDP-N-acetylglucosamine 1-carboxyvinyltransferase [Alphaproteobacteria bacterium CG_4_10_14_0_8_um_filter_53_9]
MTARYEIIGGKPVVGEIACFGAKNFATKAMVAACLGDAPTILTNVPPIGDVAITRNLLESVGVKVESLDATTLKIDPTGMSTFKVSTPDSRSNRIPILLLPILLHKFGEAMIPRLDGCNIGKRAVDIHEQAVEAFGGEIEVDEEHLGAKCVKKLKGTHFAMHYPSVGATETCLFLSVLAEGESVLTGVALEPEIMALVGMLQGMGARIWVGEGRVIRVQGVPRLGGTTWACIGDRIEAASWASLACATKGEIILNGIRPEHLSNFLPFYRQLGGGYDVLGPDKLRFYRDGPLSPIMLETNAYPGFATDWQQPFAVLLTQAEGISAIHETVYEARFGYAEMLNKMGARMQVSDVCIGQPCRFAHRGHAHSAFILGATPLKALEDPLEVPDLRAGLAYVVAAAVAEGTTTLTHIERIERGYGPLEKRLDGILNVRRIAST